MINKEDIFITDAQVAEFHDSQNVLKDANESVFFLRELEYIKAKSYDTKYKQLKATMLLPVSTEADPAAATITYQKYTKVGIAKIIADYADDAPRVDVYGEESSVKVKRIGDSYGYDRDEIRRSQTAGKSLDQRKANAAKRASDEKINSIAWNGDSDYNMIGFIDYPGITEYTVPNDGTGTTKTWSTKTPDQIIRDMSDLVTSVVDATNGVEMPDTLIMPISQYQLIANTRVTDGNDKTILTYFLENNPFIDTIDWLTELKTAGAGGTARMMCYPRDPDHVTLEIPMPYSQLPPVQKGYGFEILTETKCAGVIVYYPLSVAYGDGI